MGVCVSRPSGGSTGNGGSPVQRTGVSESPAERGLCVGIDLGTSLSCVGVWRSPNFGVEIMTDNEGYRKIPSCVSFHETELLVGTEAKLQAVLRNTDNTVRISKRLLGCSFSDVHVQKDRGHLPFKIVEGPANKLLVEVTYKDVRQYFTPQDISSFIIRKLKTMSETQLGQSVSRAVIAVPNNFNRFQRRATQDAGASAGLEVIRVISEATCAAIAYGLDKKPRAPGTAAAAAAVAAAEINVLVFDLGGGTFDATVLTIEEGVFEVKASAGDNFLGGEDFDNRLVQHCLEVMAAQDKNMNNNTKCNDIKDKKDMQDCRSSNNNNMSAQDVARLHAACERAKSTLSLAEEARLVLEDLSSTPGTRTRDFRYTITRSKFEEINADLFIKCIELVDRALKDAKMAKEKINEIVLVGGSSRIPKVQELLSSYFDGKELNKSINPDEAVTIGAAIQAAIISKQECWSEENLDVLLLDVAEHSLGIETNGGVMTPIINRNTTVPVRKTGTFSTCTDYQPGVLLRVFEGEGSTTDENTLIGAFLLEDIPLMFSSCPQIEVTFDLDSDGVLSVSAMEKSTGKEQRVTYVGRRSETAEAAGITEKYKNWAVNIAGDVLRNKQNPWRTSNALNNPDCAANASASVSASASSSASTSLDQIQALLTQMPLLQKAVASLGAHVEVNTVNMTARDIGIHKDEVARLNGLLESFQQQKVDAIDVHSLAPGQQDEARQQRKQMTKNVEELLDQLGAISTELDKPATAPALDIVASLHAELADLDAAVKILVATVELHQKELTMHDIGIHKDEVARLNGLLESFQQRKVDAIDVHSLEPGQQDQVRQQRKQMTKNVEELLGNLKEILQTLHVRSLIN